MMRKCLNKAHKDMADDYMKKAESDYDSDEDDDEEEKGKKKA